MKRLLCLLPLLGCQPQPVAPTPAPSGVYVAPVPSHADEPADPPEPEPPPAAPGAVREVDWANHDYNGFVALMNGEGNMHEYMEDYGGAHDITDWKLVRVVYGDLDGDGVEDAAIAISEEFWAPGGAAHESGWLFVYGGSPVAQLAGDMTGRCDQLRLEGRTLVLSREGNEVGRYQLHGSDLVSVK